jgi:orotidine-5'-phosphate decarboxylase
VRLGDGLRASSERHRSRVVLALDVTGPVATRIDRAEGLLSELGERLAGVKLNFQLLLPRGLEGVAGVARACSEMGLPLIADIKLNDIGPTNLDAVEQLFGAGFDAVIANPFAGRADGIGPVIARARELGRGVVLLVYMSHAGAAEGYGLRVGGGPGGGGGEPVYAAFARRVVDWDADGAIVSARSLEIIREVRRALGPQRVILSPGVGAQGGDASGAVRAGTDYAIVGRTIIEARSPTGALEEINRSLVGT